MLIRKINQKLHEVGISGTLKLAAERIRYEYRVYKWKKGEQDFDRKFKTNTLYTREEDTDARPDGRTDRLGYDPTSADTFQKALDSLRIPLEEFSFIDLGSGKGRVLLIASEFPFKRIVGVEYSPELHAIALNNIAVYKNRSQKCFSIESVCTDATVFPIPVEKLVVYLFNPFTDEILAPVLANLEASLARHPRQIYIVYAHPLYRRVIDASGFFELVRHEPGYDEYTSYAIYSNRT